MSHKVFQVVEFRHQMNYETNAMETSLIPFFNGTFDSHSKAIQRQTVAFEELTKSFNVHTQVGNPSFMDEPMVGKQIGTGVVISAEELRFEGFKTSYMRLYGIVRFEVQ